MGIIINNSGHRTVATIAERNNILKRFNGMRVYVKDATADERFGGGAAEYLWDSTVEKWSVTWAELRPDLKFASETKTIVDGKVFADNVIANNEVWGAIILNSEGVVLREAVPSVNGKTINLGTNAFDTLELRYTYAYGDMTTEMADIWNSKADKTELDPLATKIYVDSKFDELGYTESDDGQVIKSVEVNTTSFKVEETADEDDLNLQTQQIFVLDGTKNRTMAFDSPPGADKAMTVVVKFKGKGGNITWPGDILWHDDKVPELSDTFTLVVLMWDGTEWIGNVGMKR